MRSPCTMQWAWHTVHSVELITNKMHVMKPSQRINILFTHIIRAQRFHTDTLSINSLKFSQVPLNKSEI